MRSRRPPPPLFMFHCLYWHTFTVVASSSADVSIVVRRDSQFPVGGFPHRFEGTAIAIELTYCDTRIQVVNAYLLVMGSAQEYRPLLQWLRAHVCRPGLTFSSSWRGISM